MTRLRYLEDDGRPLTRARIETLMGLLLIVIGLVALSRGRGSKHTREPHTFLNHRRPLTRARIETRWRSSDRPRARRRPLTRARIETDRHQDEPPRRAVALSRGRGSKLTSAGTALSGIMSPSHEGADRNQLPAGAAGTVPRRPLTRARIETRWRSSDRPRARVALSRGRGSKHHTQPLCQFGHGRPLTRARIETHWSCRIRGYGRSPSHEGADRNFRARQLAADADVALSRGRGSKPLWSS